MINVQFVIKWWVLLVIVKIRVEDSTNDSNIDATIPHFKLGAKAAFILLGLNNTNELNESKKIGYEFKNDFYDYSGNIKILT